jgi:hypothetical protein
MNNIQSGWNQIKIDLVWDYMNENGLLSSFNINLELTDNDKLMVSDINLKNKKIQERLKQFFINNSDLLKCNYFMTNKPYNELRKFNMNNINNFSYIDLLTEKMIHYTFYANDWISQLNFYNHYINMSVIYVTGSTGTGKSTQVPKLTMYIMKMYDYRNNGKVICTTPRITPTEDNAKRISEEMGLNIRHFINKKEFKTDLYYIQYKHMKDSHIKKYNTHLTLRTVTDGTLLEELISNPIMKENNKSANNKNNIYSIHNKYDVIMVDESHEHNANMDLILTLMRQTIMYNNSIRLIIISATMDDDEIIYRNYYKLINDNIVYPIKQNIVSNIFGNNRLNAYMLDRRIHISIPKQAYSYNIRDYI